MLILKRFVSIFVIAVFFKRGMRGDETGISNIARPESLRCSTNRHWSGKPFGLHCGDDFDTHAYNFDTANTQYSLIGF
ncbi:hypothetical protein HZH68_011553 [Vespula germanica]|uniref:Secreted protein n=1 Tax=Vespula germanica TaxID=30212 RepID=A0A834N0A8_VESGE|nr:hypothetical protein HZH68_011553 [Vespula germanica]